MGTAVSKGVVMGKEKKSSVVPVSRNQELSISIPNDDKVRKKLKDFGLGKKINLAVTGEIAGLSMETWNNNNLCITVRVSGVALSSEDEKVTFGGVMEGAKQRI